MNHSTYLMNDYPADLAEAVEYGGYLLDRQNSPKLKPQLKKDGYYKSDGDDDGKISRFEKAKALLKGGTYNLVRGLFCDKDGFSIKRTLTTAILGTGIALSGPVGLAIAGGVGLLASVRHLVRASHRAENAVSDDEARKAYEGIGEGVVSAALSMVAGFKGASLLKRNFNWAKAHPEANVTTINKYKSWNLEGNHPTSRVVNPETVAEETAATTDVPPTVE